MTHALAAHQLPEDWFENRPREAAREFVENAYVHVHVVVVLRLALVERQVWLLHRAVEDMGR